VVDFIDYNTSTSTKLKNAKIFTQIKKEITKHREHQRRDLSSRIFIMKSSYTRNKSNDKNMKLQWIIH